MVFNVTLYVQGGMMQPGGPRMKMMSGPGAGPGNMHPMNMPGAVPPPVVQPPPVPAGASWHTPTSAADRPVSPPRAKVRYFFQQTF